MTTQKKTFKEGTNATVFYGSALVTLITLFYALIWPEAATELFGSMLATITEYGSWYYILSTGFVFLICLFLALSRYGEIKLGPDDSKPEYNYATWFAMLFSAGLGIALVFYGVAEPVMHFINPPNMEGGTVEAAREALNITIFHWGIHAWAIYVIIALILAVYSYRHGLPLLMRSALYPIIGDRIYGRIGDFVDIFAVCGTLFGVATSMGIGATQINAGLNALVPSIPDSLSVQALLIFFVCLLALASIISGLNRGIKYLSNLNMVIAVSLLLFVLIVGKTVPVMGMFVENVGEYASSLLSKTFNLYAYEQTNWIGGWTVFYWAWWFAWCPFVGMFIARISRGRTIREFVFGVLLIPTGFVALWMSVFGNSAISMILDDGLTIVADQVANNTSIALFIFLQQLPFSGISQIVALFLILVFFVTSADSGALVMNLLCTNGSKNPPNWMRVFWTAAIGSISFVLLYAGGLSSLQTMTIVSALPISIVLMVAIYGLFKVLVVDLRRIDSRSFTDCMPQTASNDWREKVNYLFRYKSRHEVSVYLSNTVSRALEEVAEQINEVNRNSDISADIEIAEQKVAITISHGSNRAFTYRVQLSEHTKPDSLNTSRRDTVFYRADVYLKEGCQDYDVTGWETDDVIHDVLNQYHRYIHFLMSVTEYKEQELEPDRLDDEANLKLA